MLKHMAVLMLLMCGVIGIVVAQSECPDLVQEAISVMDDVCSDVERNEACYGHGQIEVQPQPNVRLLPFDTPGDKVTITAIERLTLSELNTELDEWGVALLLVQANLPETLPGQNVAVLVFGDSEIINASDAMEVFYFRSGIGTSDCDEAPNGLLIQSPDDAESIELTINDVGITLGSTAYITAEHDDLMTFALLEGHSTLTVGDDSVTLEAGEFSTIQLDENLIASGAPSEPQTIEGNLTLPALPQTLLPRDISSNSEGGSIIPLSGNWSYTRGSIETTAGCPEMMVSMMQDTMANGENYFIDFGGENFNFETWYLANVEGEMGEGEFSEPELNTYEYNTVIEDTHMRFAMHIITETQLEGLTYIDFTDAGFDCQVTIPYSAELAD